MTKSIIAVMRAGALIATAPEANLVFADALSIPSKARLIAPGVADQTQQAVETF